MWERWKHKRILKGLGPVEPGHLRTSMQYAERRQNDCLPFMIQVEFCTVEWITAKRKLPKVPLSRLRGL